MNKHILSCLDQIQADEQLKNKTYQNVIMKTKPHSHQTSDLIITIVACCIVGLCLIFNNISNNSQTALQHSYSYMTLDTNISLELVIDENNDVIDITTYHQDASHIIKDISYQNIPYQEVIKNLLNQKNYQEYIAQDIPIQFTVYNSNVQKCEELQTDLNHFLNTLKTDYVYESVHINKDIHFQAIKKKMSSGCYFMMDKILDFDPTYPIDSIDTKNYAILREVYEDITHRNYAVSQDIQDDLMHKIEMTMPTAIYDELKKNGICYESNDTIFMSNHKYNPTLRLDFSYKNDTFVGYVSKEYGFVDGLENDLISEDEAFELTKKVAKVFFDKDVHLKRVDDLSGYDTGDYVTLEDEYQNIYLVQLNKNMVIKVMN